MEQIIADISVISNGEDEEEQERNLAEATDLEDTPLRLGVDISNRLLWTVSSAKLGNGVENLLDPSTDNYWQSDGFPPHIITVHFRSFTFVTSIMILTSEADESYAPQSVELRAGTGEESEFVGLTLLDKLDLRHGWNELTTFSRAGWGEPEDWRWMPRRRKKEIQRDQAGVREREREEYTVEERLRGDSEPSRSAESTEEEVDDPHDNFFGCTVLQLTIHENYGRGRDCRIRSMRIYSIPH